MGDLKKTSKNVREQRKKVFGTSGNPAPKSNKGQAQMQALADFAQRRYGLEIVPSQGKFDPKKGEYRKKNPKIGTDKPDWRGEIGNRISSQANAGAQSHELGHLEQMPIGIDAKTHQTIMDREVGESTKLGGGPTASFKHPSEVQARAAENPLRRRVGLPPHIPTVEVNEGDPERIVLGTESDPAAVRYVDKKGRTVDQLKSGKLLSPENRQRMKDVDEGILQYNHQQGWQPSSSPDALINLRGQGRYSEAYERLKQKHNKPKMPQKLAASEDAIDPSNDSSHELAPAIAHAKEAMGHVQEAKRHWNNSHNSLNPFNNHSHKANASDIRASDSWSEAYRALPKHHQEAAHKLNPSMDFRRQAAHYLFHKHPELHGYKAPMPEKKGFFKSEEESYGNKILNNPNRHHQFGINPQSKRHSQGVSVMGGHIRDNSDPVIPLKEQAAGKLSHLKQAPKPNLPKSEGMAKGPKLTHYSPKQNLKTLDPNYMGTGAPSQENQQGVPQIKQTSYYKEGVEPEAVVRSGAQSRYEVEGPEEHELYDIYEDPHGLVHESFSRNGGMNRDDMMGALKNAGYKGFYTTHPHYGQQGVVNLFHEYPVSNETKLGKQEETPKNIPEKVEKSDLQKGLRDKLKGILRPKSKSQGDPNDPHFGINDQKPIYRRRYAHYQGTHGKPNLVRGESQNDTLKSNKPSVKEKLSKRLASKGSFGKMDIEKGENLMKANLLRDSLIAGAMSVGMAGADTVAHMDRKPAAIQTQPAAPKTEIQAVPSQSIKDRILNSIRQVESSGGKNTNHKMVTTGLNANSRAIGSYGLMPLTVKDVVSKNKELSQKYPEIIHADPHQVKNVMAKYPRAERDIASAHYDNLARVLGEDPARIGFSWLNGRSGTQKALKEGKNLNNHWHVKKILAEFNKNK